MINESVNDKVPYLSLRNIDKYFGPTKALQQMDLDIYPGEITGLVGPNGAGKSTLIKIITGVHEPTGGTIVVNGEKKTASNYSTNMAKAYGIACAYQELSLCTNLTVYENFMINHMDHRPFAGIGWRKCAKEVTTNYMKNVFPDNEIDVNATISKLSLAQKQMVEIAKAMSYKGLKILILDEPTSSLTGDRIKQLHASMREVAEKGVAIIYISHKLDEIEKVCDSVIVTKGGTTCFKGNCRDTSMHDLVKILGGKVEAVCKTTVDNKNLPVMLEIKNLNTNKLYEISMNVKKGELIGISGLAGSGQKELILEIFKAAKGHKKTSIDVKTNVSYISGDRQNEGIFPLWDIADNTVISSLEQVTDKGLISKAKLGRLARHWYEKLKFKAQGIYDDITSLSGGNQQKALLARGLAANADLILLNDPTCGVDIETKQEIYKLLEEAKSQGRSIILHSTEDLEMEQCDRVYVMHEGRIVEELVCEQVTVSNIIKRSFEEKSKGIDNEKKEDPARQQKKGSIFRKVVNNRAFLALTTLISIFVINSILNPRIASYMGIELLYSSAVPLIFVALSQMYIVISGGIDFGSGMSLGLVNVIFAFTIVNNPGLGIVFIILFVLAYATLGAMIHLTKIPAIIITLGASFIWLGLALMISPIPGGKAPEWLSAFYSFQFPLIPMPIVIAIVAALMTYWIIKKSKYGMIINGVGNNPAAITRAGWSQLTAKTITYALAGIMLVIGGLMLTAISNSGDCNATRSYNMLSFAAIILGGCEFVGGIGTHIGVVAAALGISSISALLTFVGINSNLQSAVTGLILIVALAIKLVSGRVEANR